MKEKRAELRPGELWSTGGVILLLCQKSLPLLMLSLWSFLSRNILAGQPWPAKMLRFIKLNMNSIKSGRIVRHSRRMTLGVVHSAPGRNSDLFFFIINYRPSFKKECRRKGFRRHSVVGCVMCRAL